MLTKRHLALLRAALQFLNEELVPHGGDAVRPYLDVALDQPVTSEEVRQFQGFLAEVEPRIGLFDRQTGRMSDAPLQESIPERPPRDQVPVVVLIPSNR
ncbi:hypothetical protein [Planctellipticum variicoloris]|uniref:hypothetical protein n=1 Tax=Planctellipticum variicoloris TaxID=3064265 RepID=UPI0030137339|nr:hypothetical protein SH412_005312 [Planctomycetaceae bacterium SH412]